MSKQLNTVRTTVPDLDSYSKKEQKRLLKKCNEAHKEATEDAVKILKKTMENLEVNASGNLSDSISVNTLGSSRTFDRLESVLFFKNNDYARIANDGRKAGGMPVKEVGGKLKPDYSRLIDWARAKNSRGTSKRIVLKDISKIYWHIAKHGTEGKQFIQAARRPISRNSQNVFRRKMTEFRNGR